MKNLIMKTLNQKRKKVYWLAKKTGFHPATVMAWATNERQPGLDQLSEVAKVLDVDPKELIS